MDRFCRQLIFAFLIALTLSPKPLHAQQCFAFFDSQLLSAHQRAINGILSRLPDDWDLDVENLFSKDPEFKKFEPIYRTFADEKKYVEWVYSLVKEVHAEMDKDNVPAPTRSKMRTKKKYLDIVIAKRALQFGFSLNHGEPFYHYTTDDKSFNQRFIDQQLFYDRSIISIFFIKLEDEGRVFHGARSHALQFLFLAEYIPNFINLYRSWGLQNQNGALKELWEYYFDKPTNPGVRNNGLFTKYVFEFI